MLRNRLTLGATLALTLVACRRPDPASETQTTSAEVATPVAEAPAGAPQATDDATPTEPKQDTQGMTDGKPSSQGAKARSSSSSGTRTNAAYGYGRTKDAGISSGEGASPNLYDTRKPAPIDRNVDDANKAKLDPAQDPYGGVAPGHIMYPPGNAKGTGQPNSSGSHNIGGAE